MSKFKVGDKVITPLGVGVIYAEEEFILDLDEWHIEVVIGERFGFNRVITFEVSDLKQYKTAHERLLELGFIISDETVYHISYMLKELNITIFKKEKTYQAYSYGDNYNPIDLELAEILVDYLREIEND